MPAGAVGAERAWAPWAAAGALALVVAMAGWAGLARGGVGLAAPLACGTLWIALALGVPWLAAVSAPTPPAIARNAGRCAGAAVLGVVAALVPGGIGPGDLVAVLWPLALLIVAVGAWWAGGVALARAYGWRPPMAQALATGIALAQCTTPCVAEAVVAGAPHGAWRSLAIDLVQGANPLLVTGRDILGWDVWHLPWLYARADVAGYGHARIGWWQPWLAHAIAAAAVGGLAWIRARTRRAATTRP